MLIGRPCEATTNNVYSLANMVHIHIILLKKLLIEIVMVPIASISRNVKQVMHTLMLQFYEGIIVVIP